jgi:hypothetical protein
MRSLSAPELIELWERGLNQHPVERALSMLSACCAETPQRLATLSIGQRDKRLIEVYDRLFGSTIDAFAECPECSERLEYRMSTGELSVTPSAREEIAEYTLVADETTLQLRLPNSLDLLAIAQCADTAAAGTTLMKRCVLEASLGGTSIPVETLSQATLGKASAYLAEADPQAEILVELTCPACRHRWHVVMDIEIFLWAKVSALAKRLLREVHILAQAYGWSEADILALSSIRRQSYLEMAG